jgi:ribosomal protein L7/L12
MNNWHKYQEMREDGATPVEVYLAAKYNDNGHEIECLQMLRSVFNLSLKAAKEVSVTAKSSTKSLEEYQERFVPVIEELLADDEDGE